ncbi:MAG TPA: aminotransferase class IV, partial [Verrucomicrobiae bacterium]|nr:aminotransferase class IV [Verrucomicrobiae bacterium]
LYGDGLFETIRIVNGQPFRWREHWERFESGAGFLKIRLPLGREKLRGMAGQLVAKNRRPDSVLRLTLSRGPGGRGYSPRKATRPTLALTLHPAPPGERGAQNVEGRRRRTKPEQQADANDFSRPPQWKVIVSSFRLAVDNPLARFKTSNKLPQILSRGEADAAGADEALLANTEGFMAEGTSSNVFWIERGSVWTPPLTAGILPGVTRAVACEICERLGIPVGEKNIRLKELADSDGVFFTLTSLGIVGAESLDGKKLKQSPLVNRIAKTYNEMLFSSNPA